MNLKLVNQIERNRIAERQARARQAIVANHERDNWTPIDHGYGGPQLPVDEILDRTLPKYAVVTNSHIPLWRRVFQWVKGWMK
jgi:hypothetical protein